jgi:hypothetical protein
MLKPVRKFRDHFLRDLINRINDLETAVRVVVQSPSYRHGDVAGFNAQKGRKRIFQDLLEKFDFSYIIETGTYLGDTAGYMAKTSGLPVFSSELNPSLYSLAKMRLKEIPSVSLHNSDSREFLENLGRNPEITGKKCFLYLDAHWGKNLPLKEEISIVASRWEKFIMMIDDFQVPCDDGYVHDSYGTLEYIDFPRLRSNFGLCAYFPAMPSQEEPTGATGCVILAKENEFADPLKEMSTVKRHPF